MQFISITNKLTTFFAKDFDRNKLNIEFGKYVAILGHIFYWYLWTYLLPQPYDSAFVRFTAIGLFLPFFFKNLFPDTDISKALLDIHWYICLGYNLPYLFTYMTLMNDFSGIWLICETMAILMTVILSTRITIFIIVFTTGTLSAYLSFIATSGSGFDFNMTHLEYLLVVPMVIIGGMAFNFSARYGEMQLGLANQKAKTLTSLGGSIAHEMRNPLGSIHQSAYILLDKLTHFMRAKHSQITITKEELLEIEDLLKIIDHSSIRGNMVIDMILSNIRGEEIDKTKFKIHKISDIVNLSIKEFAFESRDQKEKVSANIEDDFYFRGDENMLVFVLFNLLKNALYYLKAYPDSRITIGTKSKDNAKTNFNSKFNYLYFRDTGPGIPSNKLESIFESFVTSGKEGGTGLGLPFCRRVITAFGGKITCNSKMGQWTEFCMSFPIIDENKQEDKAGIDLMEKDLLAKELIKQKYRDKTVLIADDQLVNRKISAARLESLGFKVITAGHGGDVLNILDQREVKIDLILMDLQMPEIDGYEATKLIRSGQKSKEGDKFTHFKNHNNIIIIAFSGDEDPKTIEKVNQHKMHGYLAKSWSNDQLLKILDKVG